MTRGLDANLDVCTKLKGTFSAKVKAEAGSTATVVKAIVRKKALCITL